MVLNDVGGRIIKGGVSEQRGSTGIKVYTGTTADRPRDVEYPFECTAEQIGNDTK